MRQKLGQPTLLGTLSAKNLQHAGLLRLPHKSLDRSHSVIAFSCSLLHPRGRPSLNPLAHTSAPASVKWRSGARHQTHCMVIRTTSNHNRLPTSFQRHHRTRHASHTSPSIYLSKTNPCKTHAEHLGSDSRLSGLTSTHVFCMVARRLPLLRVCSPVDTGADAPDCRHSCQPRPV